MEVATRETVPAHLLVKIEAFSLLDKYGVDGYETKEFVAGNYKWRLEIYPNGLGTEKPRDFVSMYLAISDTDSLLKDWEVNAVISIFLHDQIHDRYIYTRKTAKFFAFQTECGFYNFISKADFTNPANGYLIDDCCMFGAEVFVNDNNKVVTECFYLNPDLFPSNHAIKISGFSTLRDFWHSEEFTAGGHDWKIKLDVEDNSVKTESSLGVNLMYVASGSIDERVRASYTVCIKNQLLGSDMNFKNTGVAWFDDSNLSSSFRFPFLQILELNDADKGFVVNDTLLLEVEITVEAYAE